MFRIIFLGNTITSKHHTIKWRVFVSLKNLSLSLSLLFRRKKYLRANYMLFSLFMLHIVDMR